MYPLTAKQLSVTCICKKCAKAKTVHGLLSWQRKQPEMEFAVHPTLLGYLSYLPYIYGSVVEWLRK